MTTCECGLNEVSVEYKVPFFDFPRLHKTTNVIYSWNTTSVWNNSSFVKGVLEILLEPKQIDTIVSLAWTCKTILEICTKECEARLRTLLTLDPNNINLVLYKSIQKWYLFNDSPIPLRWTVSSLLCYPVEKEIWVILPPRKFIVHNITVSCPKRVTLCLYNTSIDGLLFQNSDNELHTLTLCELLDLVFITHILIKFPSLTKLRLISARLDGQVSNRHLLSLSNLVTLSIIECDLTDCDLDNWMLLLKNLRELKWENNRSSTNMNQIDLIKSINSVSIIHTQSEPLFINTTRCGREVFIK
jgi:hypothetical protein